MKYNKMNRLEKKTNEKLKREDALHGDGLFVFQNNTKGTLDLPKATASGKKRLEEGEQFQGDSYFMRLVPTMLRYIREIVPAGGPKNNALVELKENTMPEKLILDQPDRVTNQGTVENVLAEPKKQPLNESQPKQPQPDVLLTEDPMDGVEIILNG